MSQIVQFRLHIDFFFFCKSMSQSNTVINDIEIIARYRTVLQWDLKTGLTATMYKVPIDEREGN